MGTDLAKQKLTLPVIHALDRADPSQRRELQALLRSQSPRQREGLLPWLERFDSLDYARAAARRHAQTALGCLDRLDESPSKEILRQMTRFVIDRPA